MEGAVLFLLALVGLAGVWLMQGSSAFATLLWLLPVVALWVLAVFTESLPLTALTLTLAAAVFLMSFTRLAHHWYRGVEAIREHVFVSYLASPERRFYRRCVTNDRHTEPTNRADLIDRLTGQINLLESSVPPSLEWAHLAKATLAAARFYRDVLTGTAPADKAAYDRLIEERNSVLLRIKGRSVAWRALGWAPRPLPRSAP